jgi:glycosyltransferase involved in cell wall biosynthesis
MRETRESNRLERTHTPRVSIVVPTFRRPTLLRECLLSCLKQIDVDLLSVEVLVVDNSPESSAAAVVNEIASAAARCVRYVHEPTPGISSARNAGLCHARGEFIAFIDDDEIATERWLAHLLTTQSNFNADVVFGPVLPLIPASADEFCKSSLKALLTHSTNHPTGTEVASTLLVPFWARGGRKAYPRLASGNVLIWGRSPKVEGLRFDPRLGRTGGEDDLYFNQLSTDGAHFVWCAEAVTWEYVPKERLDLRYAIVRAFSGGQGVSRIPMLLEPKRPALTALSMVIALVQLPIFASLTAANALIMSPRRHHYFLRMMSAAGKLFWAAPFRIQLYGDHK